MHNKVNRIKEFIINSSSPLYVDKNIFTDIIFEEISSFVKATCSDNELFGEYEKPVWLRKLEEKKDGDISILEIDLDGASIEEQKRFISIIKDRTFMSYSLPTNTKILIYSSNKNNVDNELMGLLVVI